MPRNAQKLQARERGDHLIFYASAAARLLLNISDNNSSNPYLKGIAGLSILLLDTVQGVKSNKAQCFSMLERVHEIITAIINVCGEGGVLSPTILHSLSRFFDTLQKVHAFIRSQVDLGLLRRVLRSAETAALLENCNAGLQEALNVFGIQTGLVTTAAIADMMEHSENLHQELVELLQQDNSSGSTFTLNQISSSSLCLLPSSPKIFYGRDAEVHQLVRMLLSTEPCRVAILGPGGMGKSSLALAVLHHEDLISRFGSFQYFISLESSTSASDMLAAIAAFFNIDATAKVSRAILKHISSLSTPCVLVLDNLEECWENMSSRAEVEEFLSLLSEISQLHLMVTMRGAERPGKVRWSRPFLQPLDRLDDLAARQTFIDIVDEVKEDELTALLALTDNLPLAVTLMAHIASFEGPQSILERWANETTSLLSEGYNKQANLNKSIALSLSSPRMLVNPQAGELLSLMSLLPDGVSEETLAQMNLPFAPHIARCKSTLLRCSLIYSGVDGRLRTLAPIREYMREKAPPDAQLFDGLSTYFYDLASLFRNPTDLPDRELIQRLSTEFSNIRAVAAYALAHSLHPEDTVRCTIDLLHFNTSAKTGLFDFSSAVEEAVERLADPILKGDYLLALARVEVGRSHGLELASAALQCFEESHNLFGQARALYTLASHLSVMGQFQRAIDTADKGARFAQQAGNLSMQALCLTASSKAHRNKGDLRTALAYGSEARRLAQASGNMTAEAWVTQQYASCCVMVGDYARGAALCSAITSLLAALGLASFDVHAYKNVLNVSAEIYDRRTDYTAARALHLRIYKARRAIDDLPKAWDLLNVALIDVELGDAESVRVNLEAAQQFVPPAVWEASGSEIHAQILRADLFYLNGELRKAVEGYEAALKSAGWVDLGIIAIEKLTNVSLKTGDLRSALRYSVLLLAAAGRAHDFAATHQAVRCLGDILLETGDENTALSLFQIALSGFKLMGIHRGTGDCLIRIGDVLNSRGERSEAREMWAEARPMFMKSSQNPDVARCDERLAPL
ncbi:hypothetical protein B0H15DRAFT_914174 [Mycena belliarum]|uniref:Novel STAND NTPase 1 domain-containing protein n=1 Tax=Mycena belliarum TaxID=1033014 RepID=A0AAD6XHG6_9AGAR|nr:hypothetical protein B0H15DRAFT_914174 [Mycena belliae]